MKEAIPKIIHYCWFGGNPLPELAQKCIASWKKYCPDYEIIEWNETNFDVNCCDYVKEAYEAKKWAFVSDYARFKILYEYGGLYFDTDVEIIKPLDEIVSKGAFMGRESDNTISVAPGLGLGVNPGLGLGVNPGLGLYKEMLDMYHSIHFLNPDGTLNLKTVVSYTSEVLAEHGLQEENGIQFVSGIYIYPKEYFCPKEFVSGRIRITENTYTIHHFDSSWYMPEDRVIKQIKKHCALVFGVKYGVKVSLLLAMSLRIYNKLKYNGLKKTVKIALEHIKERRL